MKTLNKVFRTSQIAAIDKYTIEHEAISSLDLMERASRVWVKNFLKKFDNSRQVAVVAGWGNNAGDGYAIARLLKEKDWEVVVYRLMGSARMSPDCLANTCRWREIGGEVKEITSAEELALKKGTIVIDAIFGSGLNRKVEGLAADIIREINRSANRVVSVDIPSGLMGEDNAENDPDTIICADYTFTFQFPKLSFMLAENARYVGEWTVLDIGLHPAIRDELETPWFYTTEKEIGELLPRPVKFAHKGTNGRGILVAGQAGMMGGALLAAEAAVRSGIGLLYCHVPAEGGDLMQSVVPEAIPDLDESRWCCSDVPKPETYDAIAVGPALGQRPETIRALEKMLKLRPPRIILDADALNILASHRELLNFLHPGCILTPHMKEFERLAGKSENDFDRLNKLSIFANRYQVYVVLKGAHTVVANPEGQFYFNMSGNPGMAKGGAGDVLTGVLLGLAANGLEMADVARIGVFAHGLAGDLLAEEYGYRGISSGLLAEGMGKAWKRLEYINLKSTLER